MSHLHHHEIVATPELWDPERVRLASRVPESGAATFGLPSLVPGFGGAGTTPAPKGNRERTDQPAPKRPQGTSFQAKAKEYAKDGVITVREGKSIDKHPDLAAALEKRQGALRAANDKTTAPGSTGLTAQRQRLRDAEDENKTVDDLTRKIGLAKASADKGFPGAAEQLVKLTKARAGRQGDEKQVVGGISTRLQERGLLKHDLDIVDNPRVKITVPKLKDAKPVITDGAFATETVTVRADEAKAQIRRTLEASGAMETLAANGGKIPKDQKDILGVLGNTWKKPKDGKLDWNGLIEGYKHESDVADASDGGAWLKHQPEEARPAARAIVSALQQYKAVDERVDDSKGQRGRIKARIGILDQQNKQDFDLLSSASRKVIDAGKERATERAERSLATAENKDVPAPADTGGTPAPGRDAPKEDPAAEVDATGGMKAPEEAEVTGGSDKNVSPRTPGQPGPDPLQPTKPQEPKVPAQINIQTGQTLWERNEKFNRAHDTDYTVQDWVAANSERFPASGNSNLYYAGTYAVPNAQQGAQQVQ